MTELSPAGRVLTIAGSDPSGGAGLQADLKTITAFGAYGAAAVTAVTVQNTMKVQAFHAICPDMVRDQIRAVLDDVGADAVKIGMLPGPQTIQSVAQALEGFKGPIVLDPVMVATSGDRLMEQDATRYLKALLLPRATLVTPNLREAEILLEEEIPDEAMEAAAQHLLALGPKAVLLKGGHMAGDQLKDVFVRCGAIRVLTHPRQDTRHTHGTGCTYASAIAALLALGYSLDDALDKAHDFVQDAIRLAPGFGQGHGPLGHGAVVREYQQ